MSKRKTARKPEGETEGNGVRQESKEEAKSEAKPQAKERTRKEPVLRPCACGCETPTKSVWAPGHDARLWGVAHKTRSGKLSPEGALEALAGFPKETVFANADRINALAELALVS